MQVVLHIMLLLDFFRLQDASIYEPLKAVVSDSKQIQKQYEIDYGIGMNKRDINKKFIEEKNMFMSKLNYSKVLRYKVDTSSAILIQRIYRGYFIRKHLNIIKDILISKKQIRSFLVAYMLDKYNLDICSSSYRISDDKRRLKAAILIQSKFRQYLSVQYFHRRIREYMYKRVSSCVITIQSAIRRFTAKKVVDYLRYRRVIEYWNPSAIRIQSQIRRFLCIRNMKKQIIENEILKQQQEQLIRKNIIRIQCCFRRFIAKKKVSNMISEQKQLLLHRRITLLQATIRRHLSYKFVHNRKIKKLFYHIFKNVVIIQKYIRRLIARIHFQEVKRVKKTLSIASKSMYLSMYKSSRAILSSSPKSSRYAEDDLFHLAINNNLAKIEELYFNSDKSLLEKYDSQGDSILTIAARYGYLELFKKALEWGLNPNHRNKNGSNALLLSVQNQHFEIVEYLFLFKSLATSITTSTKQQSLLEDVSHNDAIKLLKYCIDVSLSSTIGLKTLSYLLSHEGLDVNVSDETNPSPLLYAASIKAMEVLEYLLSYDGIDITSIDDVDKQHLLHKACISSLEVVQVLFQQSEERQTYFKSLIDTRDKNNWSCLLLAALHGHNETIVYLKSYSNQPFASNASNASNDVSVIWNQHMISLVRLLIEHDNFECFSILLNHSRLHVNAIDESSGMSLIAIACKYGSYRILRLLLTSSDIDLLTIDNKGYNLLHHAASSPSSSMLLFMISHIMSLRSSPLSLKSSSSTPLSPTNTNTNTSGASTFTFSDNYLSNESNNTMLSALESELNETPIHIAARHGADISSLIESIDWIRKEIERIASLRNSKGQTPLQIACHYHQFHIIEKYLSYATIFSRNNKKGISGYTLLTNMVKTLDRQANSCLHHLFNPHESIRSHPSYLPIASELNYYMSRYLQYIASTSITEEKTKERSRLELETSIIIAFIRAQCPLFRLTPISIELLLKIPFSPKLDFIFTSSNQNILPQLHREDLDCGDALVQQLCIHTLGVLASELSYFDCWRLILSCIRFDYESLTITNSRCYQGNEIACLALRTLLLNGAVEIMTTPETILESSEFQVKLIKDKIRQQRYNIINHQMSNLEESSMLPLESIYKLQIATFGGLTLAAWMLRLGNRQALEYLLFNGLRIDSSADVYGNTLLHHTAIYNIPDFVDLLIHPLDYMMFKHHKVEKVESISYEVKEMMNNEGFTPSMLCAKYNHMNVFKKLLQNEYYRIDCKIALNGRYASWILAIVFKEMITYTNKKDINPADFF